MNLHNTYWIELGPRDKIRLPIGFPINLTNVFELVCFESNLDFNYPHWPSLTKYKKLLNDFRKTKAYTYLQSCSKNFGEFSAMCNYIRLGFTGYWWSESKRTICASYFPALSIKVWEGGHGIEMIGSKEGLGNPFLIPLSKVYSDWHLCQKAEIRKALQKIAILNDGQEIS